MPLYNTPSAKAGSTSLPILNLDFSSRINVAATGTSAAVSLPVGVYRVCGTTAFHLTTGTSPTATVNDAPFHANIPEHLYIPVATQVAVIKQSGSSDGIVVFVPAAS